MSEHTAYIELNIQANVRFIRTAKVERRRQKQTVQ